MVPLDGKRIFDLLLSAAGLIVLCPLLLVTAILIKLDSPGPVFFRQKRVGKGFILFELYKFRTMTAGEEGPSVTSGKDRRITRIGKALRFSKVDELPQLLNVVKGDLSLVGPRPEVEKYVRLFEEDYRSILAIRPGITDFASIKFRNEEAVLNRYDDVESGYVNEILPQKIEFYKKYLRERSFLLDVRMVLSTLIAVALGNRGSEYTVKAPERRRSEAGELEEKG